jgi:transcriptional regulator
MYVPGFNRMTDIDEMLTFINQYSFGIMVSSQHNVPIATHLPFITAYDGETLQLRSHFAVANDHWKSVSNLTESLAIFTGPHAYITPKLYDKVESVPTWNYIAVHAYGTVEIFGYHDQPERLEQMLVAMIDNYESSYQPQWQSLNDRFRNGMRQGIIGLEMTVTRIQGKAKLSQNKSAQEQAKIADSLEKNSDTMVKEIAYAMRALHP